MIFGRTTKRIFLIPDLQIYEQRSIDARSSNFPSCKIDLQEQGRESGWKKEASERAMPRKRMRGADVRQGEACIRRAVIAAKLRPIDKVKNPRRIYDVGRRGWSAAIARPCVVKRRWRGPTCAHARIWKPAAGTRHMESPRAITTPWKSCRFTSGKASVRFERLATILPPAALSPCLIVSLEKLH